MRNACDVQFYLIVRVVNRFFGSECYISRERFARNYFT